MEVEEEEAEEETEGGAAEATPAAASAPLPAAEACAAAALVENRVRTLPRDVSRPDDRVVLLVAFWEAIAEESARLAAHVSIVSHC